MIGQGMDAFEAASSAVYIHALCADHYAQERDSTGLMAGDIIDTIPAVVKQLRDAD